MTTRLATTMTRSPDGRTPRRRMPGTRDTQEGRESAVSLDAPSGIGVTDLIASTSHDLVTMLVSWSTIMFLDHGDQNFHLLLGAFTGAPGTVRGRTEDRGGVLYGLP